MIWIGIGGKPFPCAKSLIWNNNEKIGDSMHHETRIPPSYFPLEEDRLLSEMLETVRCFLSSLVLFSKLFLVNGVGLSLVHQSGAKITCNTIRT